MRFDDTFETVLASDLSAPSGRQSAWRQLIDLIGRRRIPPDTRALATLRAIRESVPLPARAASARGLEFADPPMAIVRLLAADDIRVAAPVLRTARLSSNEWIAMLAELSAAGRSVLRGRRDLGPVVKRALESFGPTDFILSYMPTPGYAAAEGGGGAAQQATAGPHPEGDIVAWDDVVAFARSLPTSARSLEGAGAGRDYYASPRENARNDGIAAGQVEPTPPDSVLPLTRGTEGEEEAASFVRLAGMAASWNGNSSVLLPGTAPNGFSSGKVDRDASHAHSSAMHNEAIARAPADARPGSAGSGERVLQSASVAETPEGPFEIADVVARIDAFWRRQQDAPAPTGLAKPEACEAFHFETDAMGVIRWVDGVPRGAVVGLSLDCGSAAGSVRVDGIAIGAFRRRARFSNARLSIEGDCGAAGDWLISAVPVFDTANGRFAGYRGTARRPRSDERAEGGTRMRASSTAESLRQLMHELRTPTNAIGGFAEMIEREILGPVSSPYRERAAAIRGQARKLLGAVDDLDLAARMESNALSLVPGTVGLRPLLLSIADDLAQLAELRGSRITLPVDDFTLRADRRAVERLLARLMGTLISATRAGERIGVRVALDDSMVAIAIDRPAALADFPGEAMLEIEDEGADATLLGTGFALRLARNLARELGGSLVIESDSLTLRLPAVVSAEVEQAHLN